MDVNSCSPSSNSITSHLDTEADRRCANCEPPAICDPRFCDEYPHVEYDPGRGYGFAFAGVILAGAFAIAAAVHLFLPPRPVVDKPYVCTPQQAEAGECLPLLR